VYNYNKTTQLHTNQTGKLKISNNTGYISPNDHSLIRKVHKNIHKRGATTATLQKNIG
jgi:hypothetical protein